VRASEVVNHRECLTLCIVAQRIVAPKLLHNSADADAYMPGKLLCNCPINVMQTHHTLLCWNILAAQIVPR
jgi:hypothetical protein